jgi:hypothetical protein
VTQQLDTIRRTWDLHRVQVLIVVAGLILELFMAWQRPTIRLSSMTAPDPNGFKLSFLPTGLLLYLSIALAVALAVTVVAVPSAGRVVPVLLSVAGVAVMVGLLVSKQSEAAVNWHSYTHKTGVSWTATPVMSLGLWLVLLAITDHNRRAGQEDPKPLSLQRAVVFGSGIGLLVLMTAGWQKQSGPDFRANISSWFTILVNATWIGSLLLAIPVVLAVALIVLPARKVTSTIVAALGLTSTVVFLLLALPRDFFGPNGEPKLVHDWLPAAYLSLAVWLIALAAAVHARVANRR